MELLKENRTKQKKWFIVVEINKKILNNKVWECEKHLKGQSRNHVKIKTTTIAVTSVCRVGGVWVS